MSNTNTITELEAKSKYCPFIKDFCKGSYCAMWRTEYVCKQSKGLKELEGTERGQCGLLSSNNIVTYSLDGIR